MATQHRRPSVWLVPRRRMKSFRGADFGDWIVTGERIWQWPVADRRAVIGNAADAAHQPAYRGRSRQRRAFDAAARRAASQSFTIDKKYVHLRARRAQCRVNLVIDGYTLIMNPMYGKLTYTPSSDRLVWRTMPVDRWVGHRAFSSSATARFHARSESAALGGPREPSGRTAISLSTRSCFPTIRLRRCEPNRSERRGASASRE